MAVPQTESEPATRPTPVDSIDCASCSGQSRRALLKAAALAGVAMPLLAACGSGSSAATPEKTSRSGGGSATPNSPAGTTDAGSGGDGEDSAGGRSALATTAQVPKGGGLVLGDDGVVITQPAAGTFKGFSSTCTHAGCTVDNVSRGTINCICHGSQFSIKDGSVVTGPATAPLPGKALVVKGKDISLKS